MCVSRAPNWSLSLKLPVLSEKRHLFAPFTVCKVFTFNLLYIVGKEWDHYTIKSWNKLNISFILVKCK